MAIVDVTWEGLQSLSELLRAIPGRGHEWLTNELLDVAYGAFEESQVQVPRRTGALAGSGSVEVTSENPPEVDIGYGGAAASYALWVHENLQAHHKAPTKAKFLEDPVNTAMATLEPKMQASVEGALVGQIPGEASSAQGRATGSTTRQYTGGRNTQRRAALKAQLRRARPMTDSEIRSALKVLDSERRTRNSGTPRPRRVQRVRKEN